ncbi:hypothetical protein [Agromyces sp. Soil535]|uniref:hypothetical protein n=1 Tax=Agromyces sp. Soil535 TaxID=1736390 RepID=UPI0006FA9486|nr:hypothetical protein [Agromyces sp. Soil535]KRE31145.1 hypothetical protein ASG80_01315 [Agromyces sp. Soil535]
MDGHRGIRLTLLIVQAFVALTALAGGAALVIGSLDPGFSTAWNPPAEYLEGGPFPSYLVPGITLAVVLGGVHVLAFVQLERRRPWALFLSAAAGYATLIWIFVQMAFIPFSFLQALYFSIGLVELGLVLMLLDVHHRRTSRRHAPADRDGASTTRHA